MLGFEIQPNRMSLDIPSEPVSPPLRDSINAVSTDSPELPAIVSISDIHGYLDQARSAMLTLNDHPNFAPVVTADENRKMHWAGEN
jgi:hypothetical protein